MLRVEGRLKLYNVAKKNKEKALWSTSSAKAIVKARQQQRPSYHAEAPQPLAQSQVVKG
jgi:hypothetical protein